MDRGPFIDNLTLGIVKYFEKLPCVKSTVIAEKCHVSEAAITAWEQKNSVLMPQDLKNFYLATDGLQIKWHWKQRGENTSIGVIEIARLSHLKSIGPKRPSTNSELPSLVDVESDSEELCNGHLKPKFKDGCKVFVLDHCQGAGKSCLVYPKKKAEATWLKGKTNFQAVDCMLRFDDCIDTSTDSMQSASIWFLDRALDFHFLTSDFVSYYRLALAHLGIPQWQLLFTPYGPPARTRYKGFEGEKEIFHNYFREKILLNMFAPERLNQKCLS